MRSALPYLFMLAALLFGLGLGGCAETLDTHGQVLQPSALAKLEVGKTTKEEARQLLGSPSLTGTMNRDRWIYVSSVVGKGAFNPHDLKSRRVLTLDFDPTTGQLAALTERTEQDGRAISPDDDATATQGQTLGIVDQLIGNLGLGDN